MSAEKVPRPPRARRTKTIALVGGLLAAAAVFACWTQVWVTVGIADAPEAIEATGQSAAPALSALALSELALVAALALAGRVLRYVLGAVQLLVGAAIAGTSALPLAAPLEAAASSIADHTGLAGDEAVRALATSVSVSAWPIVAIAAGIALVLLAVGILVSARSWPGTARRYESGPRHPPVARNAVDDWDALSGGDDPTA
jgi:hypothetical protein